MAPGEARGGGEGNGRGGGGGVDGDTTRALGKGGRVPWENAVRVWICAMTMRLCPAPVKMRRVSAGRVRKYKEWRPGAHRAPPFGFPHDSQWLVVSERPAPNRTDPWCTACMCARARACFRYSHTRSKSLKSPHQQRRRRPPPGTQPGRALTRAARSRRGLRPARARRQPPAPTRRRPSPRPAAARARQRRARPRRTQPASAAGTCR